MLLLFLLVPLLGLMFYRTQTDKVERAALQTLDSIAKLKSEELLSYLRERQGDCEIFRDSENIRHVSSNFCNSRRKRSTSEFCSRAWH